ncbi:cystathionine gamma-synthase family protein [Pseudodesulfovibrio indicus]|uniref:Cystathionine gamma-synthase n=1 Tax=Pseudodesulfovibrio indicus TaxID=1716143 RepID=A0ABN4LX67_9BACT|nr:cystathionine gamma-synthase family protein [Pseudodesulfovibrio indicus]AMK10291.1 cystathionine gamma-synthase [Pseudodesulfovibrio indicus]
MGQDRKRAMGTEAVWAGEDRLFEGNATQVPVVHSVSFGYDDMDEWMDVALGNRPGHIYSRNTNPTVSVFEEKIRVLEGGEAATSASSGMGIISNALFSLLAPGDRVVSVKDTYGGTNRMFTEFLPRVKVDVTLCDTMDHEAIEAEVARGCKILYLETPTNPTIRILDLERLSRAGKAAGATVLVDNTFATPINQNPLALGADLVLHSATKYLGGHADALGGVAVGSRELIKTVYSYREIVGNVLDPMGAYLILRGMKTLALRVERQNANALEIARFLEGHPGVERVFYPGLESHPGHGIARRQMRGFGGMLSFVARGGTYEDACRMLSRLRLAKRAANLGAVETIAGPPATTSHVECTREERAAMGIPESLIRYSVGIEDAADLMADLMADLDRALA